MSKLTPILPPKNDIEVKVPALSKLPNIDEELINEEFENDYEKSLKERFHIYNPNVKKEIKNLDAEDYNRMDKATVAPKRASLDIYKLCEEYKVYWNK